MRVLANPEPSASPFTPGYGRRPIVYAGHEREIAELVEVFDTLDFGENQSVLVSGLRGAGKTSMLALLQDEARRRGWVVISDDASSGLMERVMESTIPRIVEEFATAPSARVSGFNVMQFGLTLERTRQPRNAKPLLRHDLVALSAALERTGILITIDEVSSGAVRLRELSKFALQVAHAMNDGANVMIVFAGIRVNLEALLTQEHTTFLRRSREIDVRLLSPGQVKTVLTETVRIGGRSIDDDALDRLVSISQGYPYLVQLVGDYAWRNDPRADTITREDAEVAFDRAITAVQRRVISRVFDDLSERDQAFLAAMAQDDGPTKMADVVSRMGVSDQYAQVYKNRLIESGYVESAGRGYVRFSLPYLDQYVRALMKADEPTQGDDDEGWKAYPAPRL